MATAMAAGLVDTLKGTGPFTVMPPKDEAFAKTPAADVLAWLGNKKKLTDVLTYHVVSGLVPASVATTLHETTTVEGGKITITTADGKLTLNGSSHVTATDIHATNGVIHVIDTVLMPPAKH